MPRSLWITNYLESRTSEWRSRARYGFRNNALVLRIDNDQPTYYAGGDKMKVSSIQTGQKTGLHKGSPQDHTIPTIWKYAPKYGYFEIRGRTSARSGPHAAFWTVGKQDTPQQSAEIDVMEHPGRTPRNFNFNLFKWADPNIRQVTQSVGTSFDLAGGMHIYDRLAEAPLVYEVQVQFFLDETRTPIEAAAVVWDSPHQTVARLVIGRQEPDEDFAAQVEAAKFDPWNAVVEHRPLGEVMRARKVAYRPSQLGRGAD